MKFVTGLVLAVVLSGCSQYSVRDLTNADGTPNGLTWHGLRQTGDFASWQFSSVITSGERVIGFATDRGTGFVTPALGAGGAVGAGYFIGSGLKNAQGDTTEIDNVNGQFQEQNLNGTNNRTGK